jgi:hypothetical protein
MNITELLLDEMDREAVGIRETLERVPEGKNDWKARDVDAARRSRNIAKTAIRRRGPRCF